MLTCALSFDELLGAIKICIIIIIKLSTLDKIYDLIIQTLKIIYPEEKKSSLVKRKNIIQIHTHIQITKIS